MENSTLSALLSVRSDNLDTDYEEDLSSQQLDITLIPQRDSLYVVLPVTIIYVSILITGTVGNVSTCIVIARNKSMHTATNYYLFSLAISDLLLLLSGLPAEIYLVWCKYPYIFGEGFCVLRGLAAETSTNASVLTITAFTVERYVAICHPFLSQTMSKLSRAVKLILLIWIVALSFALPQALQFGVVQHDLNPDMIMCTVTTAIIEHSFELATFLFFVVPMTLITILYALIGLRLRKSNEIKRNVSKRRETTALRHCRNHQHAKPSRRVLKMLVAVVVAFFICWAPFHVQRLVAIYGTSTEDHMTSNSKSMESLYLLMTYVSGVLYYVSTSINPILYNIMSKKFRVAFMETLSKSCAFTSLQFRQEQRSYSSLSRSHQRATTFTRSIKMPASTTVPQESTDCSANSFKDGSPREMSELQPQTNAKRARGKAEASPSISKESATVDNETSSSRSFPKRGNHSWLTSAKCATTTIKVDNVEHPNKKCWRLFGWLPGLKYFKFPRRTNYSVPCEDPARNISMAMWNIVHIVESSDQTSLPECS